MTSENSTVAAPLEYTLYRRIEDTTGQRLKGTLQDLAVLYEKTVKPKNDLPAIGLFLAATIKGPAQPSAYTGVWLDYDNGDMTLAKLVQRLQELQLAALVWETSSSTPAFPKLRVILPFHQHRTADERRKYLAWITARIPGVNDNCTKTDKQRTYIGHSPGQQPADLVLSGFPLDLMAKPGKLDTGGFDYETRLQQVLETGDDRYHFLRDWVMSMAAQGQEEDTIRDAINTWEEEYFPGYFESLDDEKHRSIERAIVSALKKVGKVVDLKGKPYEPKEQPLFADLEVYRASDLEGVKPEAPEHVLPGWIPNDSVTMLAGHGGTGKSYLALNLALHLSQQKEILGVMPTKAYNVLLYHCEDNRNVTHWRASRYAQGYPDNFYLIDGTKTINTLYAMAGYGMMTPTGVYARLKELCELHAIEVIIFDSLSDFFGGNENDRSHAKSFINLLMSLAPCSIVLAHVNKQNAKDGQGNEYFSGSTGSTGWHNSVRSRWALMQDEAGRKTMEVQKSNWSGTNLLVDVEWNDDKKVFEFGAVKSKLIDIQGEALNVLAILREQEKLGARLYTAKSGRYSIWTLLKGDERLPAKMKEAHMNKVVQSLVEMGYLFVNDDGKTYDIAAEKPSNF